jgi:hypothetical protein
VALRPEEESRMTARCGARLLALGSALAGLVLAGCANPAVREPGATPEEALARVQGAAAKVTEARSARLSMTARTTFAGEQIAASTATTQGVYDWAAHKGQMDTTIKPAGIPVGMTERTLVIGSAIYIKVREAPDGGPATPGETHKPWIKVKLPKGLASQGGFGPGLSLVPDGGGGDPTQALLYLKAAGKVEQIGSERVRGEPTTRYAVTLDAAKVDAQVPEELQRFAEESGLAFPKPADVWIDQQGRLRKIQYTLTMKVPDGEFQGPMTIETTMELYDFGVSVDVTPPPANQVEVMGPDAPPPGCTTENGTGRSGSAAECLPGPDTGSPTP